MRTRLLFLLSSRLLPLAAPGAAGTEIAGAFAVVATREGDDAVYRGFLWPPGESGRAHYWVWGPGGAEASGAFEATVAWNVVVYAPDARVRTETWTTPEGGALRVAYAENPTGATPAVGGGGLDGWTFVVREKV